MKHNINHTSWHMFLANFGVDDYAKLRSGESIDICSYIRLILKGLFKAFGICFFATAIATWVIFSVGNLIGWIYMDYKLEPISGIFFMALLCFSVLMLFAVSKDVYDRYRRKRYLSQIYSNKEVKTSFLTLAYRKFKNKTCFKLDIV